ncbi:MAG: hypothetical protein ACR2HZ_02530 [Gemmatimonadaceae bacterium]
MSDHLPADATAATEADALTGLEGATADASGQTGRRLRPTLSGLRIRMDWRVAAGQVLLTALGVALALAGSAWWGDRQERVRERSELRNLLAAARVSERRLRQALYEDSTSLAIATRLLDSLGSVPDDSLPMLVGNSIWWSDAQPIVIPFSSLIQNGGIHLVRDARLRALLPTYVDELVARTRSVDLVNQARVALTAATLPNYVPDRLAPARTGSHRLAPVRMRAAALRAKPELRRAMDATRFFDRNTVGNYNLMLRATTEIRQELERVLGERPVPLPVPRLRRDSF